MSNIAVRSVWIKLLVPVVASAALCSGGAKHVEAASGATDEGAGGEIKFNTFCRQCHSFVKDDNRLGPSLYGVIGRKAGTATGYLAYSPGMKTAGWVWTPDMIDKWITNPYKILPNTNMRPFPGVPDPKVRQQIIAFLASRHD